MQNPPKATATTSTAQRLRPLLQKTQELERKSWINWVMITMLVIVNTCGLAGAIFLMKRNTESAGWPWGSTETTLLVGLALSVLVFTLYLTNQQRQLSRLRCEVLEAQRENNERFSRHLDRLMAILGVSRTMGTENDPKTVLKTITASCYETFDCHRVTMMLLDRETQELEVCSASGSGDVEQLIGARLAVGQGVAGWVAEHREPVILGPELDTSRYKDFKVKESAPTAAMVVPIVLRDELIGVLNITSLDPKISYEDADLQALLVFAENAGICCRHAEQAEWMRATIRRLDAELSRQKPGSRLAA